MSGAEASCRAHGGLQMSTHNMCRLAVRRPPTVPFSDRFSSEVLKSWSGRACRQIVAAKLTICRCDPRAAPASEAAHHSQEESVTSNANLSRPVTLSEAHDLLRKMRSAANDDQDAPAAPAEDLMERLGTASRPVISEASPIERQPTRGPSTSR